MKDEEDKKLGQALEIVLSWIARFNRRSFFTKELYKKLPAYKKAGIQRDKTEIQVAFICKALQEHGIYTTPCGIAWSNVWDDSESATEYLERYQPIFDGYVAWCAEQR